MTGRQQRVVDAHVHLWDPARSDWYPYLAGKQELELGDVSHMARRFDVPTYLAESSPWRVEKIVNVAAATGRYSIDETLELDALAEGTGLPTAIVGGMPPTETTREAIALLDRQMAAPRFRGVRPMGAIGSPLPPDDVLHALAERRLLFELMAHPDQLLDAARALARHEELVVVIEHTGWPRSDTAEERALWAEGMRALAGLGARVVCKISGLAMPLGTMDADALRPWIEGSLEVFGVDRCLFASNFPVDAMRGTFDELYGAYATVTAGLDARARAQLFATNAERVYRC